MDTKSTLHKLSDWLPIFLIIGAQLGTTLWSHDRLTDEIREVRSNLSNEIKQVRQDIHNIDKRLVVVETRNNVI